jgi:hypothetical protein
MERLKRIRNPAFLKAICKCTVREPPAFAPAARRAYRELLAAQVVEGRNIDDAVELVKGGDQDFIGLVVDPQFLKHVKSLELLKALMEKGHGPQDGADRTRQRFWEVILDAQYTPEAVSEARSLLAEENAAFDSFLATRFDAITSKDFLETIYRHSRTPETKQKARDALDVLRGVVTVRTLGKLVWTAHASSLPFVVGGDPITGEEVRNEPGNFVLVAFTKEGIGVGVGRSDFSMSLRTGEQFEFRGVSVTEGPRAGTYHPLGRPTSRLEVRCEKGTRRFLSVLAFECPLLVRPNTVRLSVPGIAHPIDLAVPGP